MRVCLMLADAIQGYQHLCSQRERTIISRHTFELRKLLHRLDTLDRTSKTRHAEALDDYQNMLQLREPPRATSAPLRATPTPPRTPQKPLRATLTPLGTPQRLLRMTPQRALRLRGTPERTLAPPGTPKALMPPPPTPRRWSNTKRNIAQ
jgi:hypothetical protein